MLATCCTGKCVSVFLVHQVPVHVRTSRPLSSKTTQHRRPYGRVQSPTSLAPIYQLLVCRMYAPANHLIKCNFYINFVFSAERLYHSLCAFYCDEKHFSKLNMQQNHIGELTALSLDTVTVLGTSAGCTVYQHRFHDSSTNVIILLTGLNINLGQHEQPNRPISMIT